MGKGDQRMTKQEYEKVITIIKQHFHISTIGNGYPKMIITTDNMATIEKELKELINGKSTKKK